MVDYYHHKRVLVYTIYVSYTLCLIISLPVEIKTNTNRISCCVVMRFITFTGRESLLPFIQAINYEMMERREKNLPDNPYKCQILLDLFVHDQIWHMHEKKQISKKDYRSIKI
jgi:hypothetical protein